MQGAYLVEADNEDEDVVESNPDQDEREELQWWQGGVS